jgi:HEPN domain-containing protein
MDNKESIINRWIESSDEDFDTMLVLYETRKYHWALFIGHIVIEKLLKAYYVLLNDDYAPYTHMNLQKNGLTK